MATYKIVRFFQSTRPNQTIKRHLTLEEARAHCNNPETSSRTARSREAVLRTKAFGHWFDGYEKEGQ